MRLEERKIMKQIKNKVRILIVDNDTAYGLTVKEALEEVGYEVVGVSNAQDALAHVNEKGKGFDLALVDVRLNDDEDSHDHSGLKLLHDLPKNLPVVVLTAHEDGRVVRDAYLSAPDQPEPKDYLFKGDGLEVIKRCVKNISAELSPTSRPWYKEKGFYYFAAFTVILILVAGFYIAYNSQGYQILGVIGIGVVVEILAAVMLKFLKIGQ
jgi:CheY-like chemotaxis protein